MLAAPGERDLLYLVHHQFYITAELALQLCFSFVAKLVGQAGFWNVPEDNAAAFVLVDVRRPDQADNVRRSAGSPA